MSLSADYLEEISKHSSNDYDDNWDYIRYGKEPEAGITPKILSLIADIGGREKYRHRNRVHSFSDKVRFFDFLYNNLSAEHDKKLLVRLMAYYTLGHRKVKLPLSTPAYWKSITHAASLLDKLDVITMPAGSVSLYKTDITSLGFPVKLYFTEAGIVADFIIKQYEYNNNGVLIKAEAGDCVIDCGGCFGDTALYFANETGVNGKVISLEFIPENVSVFKKNISLNEVLEKSISLVERPVWNNSSTKMYFKNNGPGSVVKTEPFKGMDGSAMSVSIDDMVKEINIPGVDFIKMDIEGAESQAIAGAAETIKKFRPKLAIALYHSIADFERIPVLIKSIVPEYQLYFSHSTIHTEESFLFARV